MQLYKYNLLEKKRQLDELRNPSVDKRQAKKYFMKLPNFCIEEENDNEEVHLMFAHCVGDHDIETSETLCDTKFLSHHYILKQPYFREKSEEEKRQERMEIDRKRKDSESKGIPYEEEPEVIPDVDFEIINFSYHQTEKSKEEMNEFRKKEAIANSKGLKFEE